MTWEKVAVMMNVTEYINKISEDFKDTMIKHIKQMCFIRYDEAKVNGITLHGNVYSYVRDGFSEDVIVKVSYERLLLDMDDDVICEFTEDCDGEKKEMGMHLRGMSIEMIHDMVQNI